MRGHRRHHQRDVRSVRVRNHLRTSQTGFGTFFKPPSATRSQRTGRRAGGYLRRKLYESVNQAAPIVFEMLATMCGAGRRQAEDFCGVTRSSACGNIRRERKKPIQVSGSWFLCRPLNDRKHRSSLHFGLRTRTMRNDLPARIFHDDSIRPRRAQPKRVAHCRGRLSKH